MLRTAVSTKQSCSFHIYSLLSSVSLAPLRNGPFACNSATNGSSIPQWRGDGVSDKAAGSAWRLVTTAAAPSHPSLSPSGTFTSRSSLCLHAASLPHSFRSSMCRRFLGVVLSTRIK